MTIIIAGWKVGPFPLIFNNIYLGEVYDARMEKAIEGWGKVLVRVRVRVRGCSGGSSSNA
jgi:hypothetical protein